MKTYKKLEIVIPKLEAPRLIQLLNRQGMSGYSYWDQVKGRGDRGTQDGEGLSEAFTNCFFLIACTEEEFEQVREKVRTLLKEVGGICLVSEAGWLLH